MPDRSHPRSRKRAQQKITQSHHRVGEHQRPPKPEAVRESSSKHRQEPNHEPKNSQERAGLLNRHAQIFVEINRQNGSCCIIGEPLEKLGRIRNPETTLEPVANLFYTLSECHVLARSSAPLFSAHSLTPVP